MDAFGVFNVSASALAAQRQRMNVIASNMANAHSTKTDAGGPYRRQDVVFTTDPVEHGQAGLEVFVYVRERRHYIGDKEYDQAGGYGH